MPTDPFHVRRENPVLPARRAGSAWAAWVLPCLLMIVLALPDLLAPPISPTILRQTQTYAQTVHFVAAGFSPTGLAIDIDGPRPFHVVYEFPLYHAIVGALFVAFGPSFFAGKCISLIAALASLALFQHLVRTRWSDAIATRASLLFASCPIALLLTTGFQPDTLALALTLAALLLLQRWHEAPSLARWLTFLVALLGAGLAKFTLVVPFVPLIAATLLRRHGRWRMPSVGELLTALIIFVSPFAAWYAYRGRLMDPAYLAIDSRDFFLGDLRRFLRPGYYTKPSFILGAMVSCGTGVAFLVAGLRRLNSLEWLLLAGVPLYFVLLPTASEQTYYAYALVPLFALLMGRGLVSLETRGTPRATFWVRTACSLGWIAGLAVAAPYTLRRDTVTLDAAVAVRAVSQPGDFLFVMNMHDRGVGIGAFNPAMMTLAGRRGWNVDFTSSDPTALRSQIETRRAEGARWLVATWFTSDLDPWFTPLLPGTFSRQPRSQDTRVDGQAIVNALARSYPIVTAGPNYAVLALR